MMTHMFESFWIHHVPWSVGLCGYSRSTGKYDPFINIQVFWIITRFFEKAFRFRGHPGARYKYVKICIKKGTLHSLKKQNTNCTKDTLLQFNVHPTWPRHGQTDCSNAATNPFGSGGSCKGTPDCECTLVAIQIVFLVSSSMEAHSNSLHPQD